MTVQYHNMKLHIYGLHDDIKLISLQVDSGISRAQQGNAVSLKIHMIIMKLMLWLAVIIYMIWHNV